MKLPLQPVLIDKNGVVRFQENTLVRALLDVSQQHGLGLNELAWLGTPEEHMQLASLIGYSVSGFHELSYVTDAVALAVSAAARELDPRAGGCRDVGCPIHADERLEAEE